MLPRAADAPLEVLLQGRRFRAREIAVEKAIQLPEELLACGALGGRHLREERRWRAAGSPAGLSRCVTSRQSLDSRPMLEIHHRETGAVLLAWPEAALAGARLAGRNLLFADLRGADLTAADLRGADLCSADLTGATLAGARLVGADLTGAVLRGVRAPEARLTDAKLVGADLTESVFDGSDFTRVTFKLAYQSEGKGPSFRNAGLSRTYLAHALLRGADLSGADCTEACLNGSNLGGACLTGASLRAASLRMTRLAGADLRQADLTQALFHETDLTGADLALAIMGGTVLARSPTLAAARGLAEVRHAADSCVDLSTLAALCRRGAADFLEGIGVSAGELDLVRRLDPQPPASKPG
jgi:uncharacterized protein YjbI with pentapeptide repeats